MSSEFKSTLSSIELLNYEINNIDKKISNIPVNVCIEKGYTSLLKNMVENSDVFSLDILLLCIIYNRLECLKIIYDLSNKEYNNFLIRKSIIHNRLNILEWLYKNNTNIPNEGLITSILNDNNNIKNWILENTVQYPVLSIDIVKLLKYDHEVNDLVNYEIKSIIIIKELLDTKYNDELDNIINKYIDLYKNFKPNYKILMPVWHAIETNLLIYSFKKNNDNLLKNILLKGINISSLHKLFDIIIYEYDDIYIKYLWELDNKKLLNNYYKQICSYYVYNIPEDIYYNITTNKDICINVSICETCINKRSLLFNEWKNVFSEEKQSLIYKSESNYCFVINSLFKCWESELNSFNYVITPQYPTNPYNKELINPLELYKIIIYASIYKVEIPFILQVFIKNPSFVIVSYNKFLDNCDNKKVCYNYIKNFLITLGLKYSGGDSSNNIAGEWIIDNNDHDSKEYYYEKIIKYNIAIFLLIKAHFLTSYLE